MTQAKSERDREKELRRLAGLAWDRELEAQLEALEGAFAEWRRGAIDAHELSDRIHAFHDGPSRRLYVFHSQQEPDRAVARAMALGLLREEELEGELLEELRPLVELFASLEEG